MKYKKYKTLKKAEVASWEVEKEIQYPKPTKTVGKEIFKSPNSVLM